MSFILWRRLAQNTIQKNGGNYACLHTNREKPSTEEGEEFRVLHLKGRKIESRVFVKRPRMQDDMYVGKRVDKMDPDNFDWPSIWPGPRSFHPHSVPLPVRQGKVGHSTTLNKYANPELMKIPNFFHLTPPAVKAHCEELKKFCSAFPKALDSRTKCDEHFPITVTTHDYLHSSPSIRDPAARVVSVKLRLKSLPLNRHARDKLFRLVGPRYDPRQNSLTIVTDRCPLRKQNYEYALYLLTALFYESWKKEAWEYEKSEQDREAYIWSHSAAFKNIKNILDRTPGIGEVKPLVSKYRRGVSEMMQEETVMKIAQYGQATRQLLLRTSNSSEDV